MPWWLCGKRYQPESWAPTAVAWSVDNRTCGFRVVGHGPSFRLESRIPGGDVNPYLAYAATIAAGLHGIEHGIAPPPRFNGNAYAAEELTRVPSSLAEATEAFASLCEAKGIEAPILREIQAILFQGKKPAAALAALMTRGLKRETTAVARAN